MKLRSRAYLPLLALPIAAVPAFVARAQTAPGTRYSDPSGFSIQVPAGFTRNTERAPAGSVLFMGKTANNYTPNILIQPGTSGTQNFDDVSQASDKGLMSDKAATILGRRTVKSGPGSPAMIWHVRRKATDTITVEQWQILSFHNGKACIISTSALIENTKTQGPLMEQVVNSFRWDK